MHSAVNRQVVLARHLDGSIPSDLFCLAEAPIPKPAPGEILVRNQLASVDPGLAGAINGSEYLVPSLAVGDVIRSTTIGTVVQSRCARFREGDIVHIRGGWQDYTVLDGESELPPTAAPFVVDTRRAPAEAWMALLSVSAFTAYIGMMVIARPKAGETTVVSAAAGSVGGIAAQLAAIAGTRVVGITGGANKCSYLLNDLRLDEAVDYRREDFVARLDEACPRGIDIYFENVGGTVLEAVWPRLNTFARVPLSGQVAQYQSGVRPPGPNLFEATIKRLTLTGFLASDLMHARHFPAFQEMLLEAFESGRIQQRVDIVEGLENAFEAWQGLFRGSNIGKRLLRLA